MKNINLIKITCVLLVSFLLASCYEDKSVVSDLEFDGLVTAPIEGQYLNAYFQQNFKFDPKLGIPPKEKGLDTLFISDANESDFSYEWKISRVTTAWDTAKIQLSTDRVLDVKLDMVVPDPYKYNLTLEVVEKTTGAPYLFQWYVNVLSNFAQGMLIVDTKDNVSSDINLLVTKEFSSDFRDEDIGNYFLYKDLVESSNAYKIDGLLQDIKHTNGKIFTLERGKGMHAFDKLTFNHIKSNEDFFLYPDEMNFNPMQLARAGWGGFILLNDNQISCCELRNGTKFNYLGDYPHKFGDRMVECYGSWLLGGYTIGHDKSQDAFTAIDSYGGHNRIKSNSSGEFDPGNISDIEIIYGTDGFPIGKSANILTKSTVDDSYKIHKITYSDEHEAVIGEKLINLDNCVNVKNATSYEFNGANREFYYSVDNDIYVAILNTTTPSSKITYSLPDGENITKIQIPGKGDMGYTYWNLDNEGEPSWKETIRNLIVVCSYNETTQRGYVRTIPIQYGGAGGFASEEYIKLYGDKEGEEFGKILCVEFI